MSNAGYRGRNYGPRGARTNGPASGYNGPRFMHPNHSRPPHRLPGPDKWIEHPNYKPWQQNKNFYHSQYRGNLQFRPNRRGRANAGHGIVRFSGPGRPPGPQFCQGFPRVPILGPVLTQGEPKNEDKTVVVSQAPLLGSEEERQLKISETADKLKQKLSCTTEEDLTDFWNDDVSYLPDNEEENNRNRGIPELRHGPPELDLTFTDFKDIGRVGCHSMKFGNVDVKFNNEIVCEINFDQNPIKKVTNTTDEDIIIIENKEETILDTTNKDNDEQSFVLLKDNEIHDESRDIQTLRLQDDLNLNNGLLSTSNGDKNLSDFIPTTSVNDLTLEQSSIVNVETTLSTLRDQDELQADSSQYPVQNENSNIAENAKANLQHEDRTKNDQIEDNSRTNVYQETAYQNSVNASDLFQEPFYVPPSNEIYSNVMCDSISAHKINDDKKLNNPSTVFQPREFNIPHRVKRFAPRVTGSRYCWHYQQNGNKFTREAQRFRGNRMCPLKDNLSGSIRPISHNVSVLSHDSQHNASVRFSTNNFPPVFDPRIATSVSVVPSNKLPEFYPQQPPHIHKAEEPFQHPQIYDPQLSSRDQSNLIASRSSMMPLNLIETSSVADFTVPVASTFPQPSPINVPTHQPFIPNARMNYQPVISRPVILPLPPASMTKVPLPLPKECLQNPNQNTDIDNGLEDMQKAMEFAKQLMNMSTEKTVTPAFSQVPLIPSYIPLPKEAVPRFLSTKKKKAKKLKKREIPSIKTVVHGPQLPEGQEEIEATGVKTESTESPSKSSDDGSLSNEQIRPKVVFNLNSKTKKIHASEEWQKTPATVSEYRETVSQDSANGQRTQIRKSYSEDERSNGNENRIQRKIGEPQRRTNLTFDALEANVSLQKANDSCQKNPTRNSEKVNPSRPSNTVKAQIKKDDAKGKAPTSESSWKGRVINRFLKMSKNDIFNMVNNTSLRKFDIAMEHLVKESRSSLSLKMRNTEDEKMKEYDKEEFVKQLNAMLEPNASVAITDLPMEFIHHLSEFFDLDSELYDNQNVDADKVNTTNQDEIVANYSHEETLPVSEYLEPQTVCEQDAKAKSSRNKEEEARVHYSTNTELNILRENTNSSHRSGNINTEIENAHNKQQSLINEAYLDNLLSEVTQRTRKSPNPTLKRQENECHVETTTITSSRTQSTKAVDNTSAQIPKRTTADLDDIFSAGVSRVKQPSKSNTDVDRFRARKSNSEDRNTFRHEKFERWNKKEREREDVDVFRNLNKEEWDAKYRSLDVAMGPRRNAFSFGSTENLSKGNRYNRSLRYYTSESPLVRSIVSPLKHSSDRHNVQPDKLESGEIREVALESSNNESSTASSSSSEVDEETVIPNNVTKLLKVIKQKEKIGKSKSFNETIRDEVAAEIEKKWKEKSKQKERKSRKREKRKRDMDKRKKEKQRERRRDSDTDSTNERGEEFRLLTEDEIKKEEPVNSIGENVSKNVIGVSTSITSQVECQNPQVTRNIVSSQTKSQKSMTLSKMKMQQKTKAQLKQMPEVIRETQPVEKTIQAEKKISTNINNGIGVLDTNKDKQVAKTQNKLMNATFSPMTSTSINVSLNVEQSTSSTGSHIETKEDGNAKKMDQQSLSALNFVSTNRPMDQKTSPTENKTTRKIDIKAYKERTLQRRLKEDAILKGSLEKSVDSANEVDTFETNKILPKNTSLNKVSESSSAMSPKNFDKNVDEHREKQVCNKKSLEFTRSVDSDSSTLKDLVKTTEAIDKTNDKLPSQDIVQKQNESPLAKKKEMTVAQKQNESPLAKKKEITVVKKQNESPLAEKKPITVSPKQNKSSLEKKEEITVVQKQNESLAEKESITVATEEKTPKFKHIRSEGRKELKLKKEIAKGRKKMNKDSTFLENLNYFLPLITSSIDDNVVQEETNLKEQSNQESIDCQKKSTDTGEDANEKCLSDRQTLHQEKIEDSGNLKKIESMNDDSTEEMKQQATNIIETTCIESSNKQSEDASPTDSNTLQDPLLFTGENLLVQNPLPSTEKSRENAEPFLLQDPSLPSGENAKHFAKNPLFSTEKFEKNADPLFSNGKSRKNVESLVQDPTFPIEKPEEIKSSIVEDPSFPIEDNIESSLQNYVCGEPHAFSERIDVDIEKSGHSINIKDLKNIGTNSNSLTVTSNFDFETKNIEQEERDSVLEKDFGEDDKNAKKGEKSPDSQRSPFKGFDIHDINEKICLMSQQESYDKDSEENFSEKLNNLNDQSILEENRNIDKDFPEEMKQNDCNIVEEENKTIDNGLNVTADGKIVKIPLEMEKTETMEHKTCNVPSEKEKTSSVTDVDSQDAFYHENETYIVLNEYMDESDDKSIKELNAFDVNLEDCTARDANVFIDKLLQEQKIKSPYFKSLEFKESEIYRRKDTSINEKEEKQCNVMFPNNEEENQFNVMPVNDQVENQCNVTPANDGEENLCNVTGKETIALPKENTALTMELSASQKTNVAEPLGNINSTISKDVYQKSISDELPVTKTREDNFVSFNVKENAYLPKSSVLIESGTSLKNIATMGENVECLESSKQELRKEQTSIYSAEKNASEFNKKQVALKSPMKTTCNTSKEKEKNKELHKIKSKSSMKHKKQKHDVSEEMIKKAIKFDIVKMNPPNTKETVMARMIEIDVEIHKLMREKMTLYQFLTNEPLFADNNLQENDVIDKDNGVEKPKTPCVLMSQLIQNIETNPVANQSVKRPNSSNSFDDREKKRKNKRKSERPTKKHENKSDTRISSKETNVSTKDSGKKQISDSTKLSSRKVTTKQDSSLDEKRESESRMSERSSIYSDDSTLDSISQISSEKQKKVTTGLALLEESYKKEIAITRRMKNVARRQRKKQLKNLLESGNVLTPDEDNLSLFCRVYMNKLEQKKLLPNSLEQESKRQTDDAPENWKNVIEVINAVAGNKTEQLNVESFEGDAIKDVSAIPKTKNNFESKEEKETEDSSTLKNTEEACVASSTVLTVFSETDGTKNDSLSGKSQELLSSEKDLQIIACDTFIEKNIPDESPIRQSVENKIAGPILENSESILTEKNSQENTEKIEENEENIDTTQKSVILDKFVITFVEKNREGSIEPNENATREDSNYKENEEKSMQQDSSILIRKSNNVDDRVEKTLSEENNNQNTASVPSFIDNSETSDNTDKKSHKRKKGTKKTPIRRSSRYIEEPVKRMKQDDDSLITEIQEKRMSRKRSAASETEIQDNESFKRVKRAYKQHTMSQMMNCVVKLVDCRHTIPNLNENRNAVQKRRDSSSTACTKQTAFYSEFFQSQTSKLAKRPEDTDRTNLAKVKKILLQPIKDESTANDKEDCSDTEAMPVLTKEPIVVNITCDSNAKKPDIEIVQETKNQQYDNHTASTLTVIDAKDDTDLPRTSYTVHKGPILDIKVFAKSFLAASEDGKIYRYNQISNGILNIYIGHTAAVTCLYVRNARGTDGEKDLMFSGSLDGTLRCYNIITGMQERDTANVGSPVQCMDESWGMIFIGTKSGHVSRYHIKSGVIKGSPIQFSDKSVLALKATNEGPRKVLIVASRSQPITIRDAQNGLFLRTICGHKCHTVYSLLRDHNLIYCGTSSTSIPVFDFTIGEQTMQYDAGVGIVCMRLYSGLLFAGCYDGNIYVFNTKDHRLVCSIPGPGNMLLSMEVIDNKIIAGSKDKRLHLWQMPRQVRALL